MPVSRERFEREGKDVSEKELKELMAHEVFGAWKDFTPDEREILEKNLKELRVKP